MNTLHAVIKFGSEVVHKDRSVSAGAFSLNGHDSSYIMSAKKDVPKVHTLDCKSTNMQSADFHNPAGQQYSSGHLVWRLHNMPLQAVTCHFFIEAFIISHVRSHCMCSKYHVLKCSGMYVMFISISCHSPSDTGGTSAYTLTALELFLLHKEFNQCTLANECN
jgi:hypothetical protein